MPPHIFEQAVRSLTNAQYEAFHKYITERRTLRLLGEPEALLRLVNAFHKEIGHLNLSLSMIGYTTQEGTSFTVRSLELIRGKR